MESVNHPFCDVIPFVPCCVEGDSLSLKIISLNGAVFFYSDRTPVGVEIRDIEGAVIYGDRGSIGIKR